MMKKIHLETITNLVTHARDSDAPFREEDLAMHLNDEASRYFSSAQTLRAIAHTLEEGLVRDTMLANAEGFEEYSRHVTSETLRLIGLLTPEAKERIRDAGGNPDVSPLPFITPAEEA